MTIRLGDISLATIAIAAVVVVGSVAGIAVADTPFDDNGGVAATDAGPDAEIDEELQDAEDKTEVVVRFEPADRAAIRTSGNAIETLKATARTKQDPLQRYASQTRGVSITNDFWIANAALVTIDMDRAKKADSRPLEEIAALPHVDRLHKNFEVTLDGVESASGTDATAAGSASVEADQNETTYGLDMINATQVWDQFGTKGEGARVAVLDTGVDGTHPDIDIDPANWQEFDDAGNPIDSEPNDGNGHGTHVSGTVIGPVDPAGDVPRYGVAPDAELYHGKVLDDGGGGTWAKIIAGMEWAVNDTDADVVSMSLGADGYHSELVEPSENARQAGVVLVVSAGNSYEGTTGSPGNVYPNFASGAVNESHGVADFSSGDVINTSEAYPDAPDYWPDQYTVPNAAAPGVDILSSVPGGGYDDTYSGTSMSAPHHAGTFALMVSASGGDADRETLIDAMEQTAWKPDDWDQPDGEYDNRYGLGIIDAAAATAKVAQDSGIEGTVTDASGTPIEGATVTIAGREVETNASGYYSFPKSPGTYDVTADAFGSVAETKTVTIRNASHVATLDVALPDALDAELAADQRAKIEAGENLSTTMRVANVDELAVELEGSYDAADATLYVNGAETGFGEPVSFDGYDGELTLEVKTAERTDGTLSLNQTYTGQGERTSIQTGPTTVYPDLTRVGVVDDGRTYGEEVATALDARLPDSFNSDVITSDEAITDINAFDGYVVQNIDSANANDFVTNTSGPTVGVVYLDQWDWERTANGIEVYAAETGDPTETFEAVDGETPIRYNVVTSHEILDGFSAGETVDIHNAGYPDHTWFNGTDFEELATIDNNNETKGPALAVDEDNFTVLASSLGRTSYVGNADYTADADAILANSVEYATSYEPEFHGTVAVGDNPAPEGAVVEAYVDGELRGSTVVETAGEYGSSDDPFVVDGSSSDQNATITFTVDGMPVAETATWSSGSVRKLDLNASGTATVDVELGGDRSGEELEEPTITATGEYGTFAATQTGAGQYVFENLPADRYAVTANAAGYEAETNDSVTVGVNGTTAVDFWLVGDATIEGTLADVVTGAVPANATVTVAYPDGTPAVETVPDAGGAFTVSNVPGTGEVYTVAATAPGYDAAAMDVAVTESAATDVGTIDLAGSASIAGAVETDDGNALPNATVTATAGEGAYGGVTDGNGTYVIDDVPGTGADYTVNATARGFSTDTTTVADVTGHVTGVNATLVQLSQYLGVDALTTADTVEEGDTVAVNATIVNLGTGDANDTATLLVNGSERASRNVSLNGTDGVGGSDVVVDNATVTFTHTPESPGNVTFGIATSNETVNATVSVEEAASGGPALPPPPEEEPAEPALEIVDHSLSTAEIEVGDSITVETTVANSGDAAGSTTLELAVDGRPVDYASAEVAAGGDAAATFEHTFYEPGEYELAVDGEVIGTVTVVEPEQNGETGETDDGSDSGDDSTDDDSIPGFGVEAAILALFGICIANRLRN